MINELDEDGDPTVAEFDSSYSTELMEPTADTPMNQATEKKKRERGKERTSNDRRKTDKAKDDGVAYRDSVYTGLPA